ncbi:MAG: hypothetical protein M3P91_11925 [Actinomycetota bacterium]|nr:hypothetical protein [Actinomycetota bacterium]
MVSARQPTTGRQPALSRQLSTAPASANVVRDALAGLPVGDEYVDRFAAAAASMAALAGLLVQDSDQEAYGRYREWLAFVSSADAFTTSVRDDIGQNDAVAVAGAQLLSQTCTR